MFSLEILVLDFQDYASCFLSREHMMQQNMDLLTTTKHVSYYPYLHPASWRPIVSGGWLEENYRGPCWSEMEKVEHSLDNLNHPMPLPMIQSSPQCRRKGFEGFMIDQYYP